MFAGPVPEFCISLRDWHVRQLCHSMGETAPAAAARALGYDPNNPPQDLVQVLGAYWSYHNEITDEPESLELSESGGGRIRLWDSNTGF